MKRFIPYIGIIAILLSTSFIGLQYVHADKYDDIDSMDEIKDKINSLQEKQDSYNKQADDIQGKKESIQGEIDENLDEQDIVATDIEEITQKINNTKLKINKKEKAIKETNEEIDDLKLKISDLKKDIKELKKKIKERDELLKDRLKTMQSNGGALGYLDVLLGADSFSEFISRARAVNTIMDQDKSILEQHARDKEMMEKKKEEVESKKAKVEKEKENLEDQKGELVGLKSKLDKQVSKKQVLMDELKEKEKQLEDHKMSLEEKQQTLNRQAAVLEKFQKNAEARKAEIKKAQEAALSQLGDTTPTTNGNVGVGTQVQAKTGSNRYLWPVTGHVTSVYGNRPPPYGNHVAIDIGAPSGTPVYAARSGVVTRAYHSASYGNVVFLYHPDVNQSTVYAHMTYYNVSEGQTITVGQQIGAVGNTGHSFGHHLHFEVQNGKWHYKGGIPPLPYLE